MGLFRWLGNSNDQHQQAAPAPRYFWEQHPSIYEYIDAGATPGRDDRSDAGPLPDDERVNATSKVHWAPGALDGVMTHHWGGKSEEDVNAVLPCLRAYCDDPTPQNKQQVHQVVVPKTVASLVDPLLQCLIKTPNLNQQRLYELGRSLALQSPDREPVKLGVAILGLYGRPEDKAIFQTLGRHDEFTLYCAVALRNASDESENDLWQLAQSVHGWGRIHTVERLSKTDNPAIRQWLLREGFRNSVMNEYLALICASSGGLAEALAQSEVDDELMESASELIPALIAGGPAPGLDAYEDGVEALERFLYHLTARATSLKQLLSVNSLKEWLEDDKRDWTALQATGWVPEKRSLLLDRCEQIIARPMWRDLTLVGLRSDDALQFALADQAALLLGIETWDFHWKRLEQSPLDPGQWFPIMRECNAKRIAEVVAFAQRYLPLEKIATGAASEAGFGKLFEAHSCLDCILQELGRFAVLGVNLVEAGLRSPVIRNRNMALQTLARWGKDRWPQGMSDLLSAAVAIEPEESVKALMQKVLAGQSWDEATAAPQ